MDGACWRSGVWSLQPIQIHFTAGLVFDSNPVIEQDPRIREASLQNIRSILTGPYWYVNATAGLYRPVTTFSYLVNYAALGDGTRPVGYHWVNFALHAINTALVLLARHTDF